MRFVTSLILLAAASTLAAQTQPKKIVVTGRGISYMADLKAVAPGVTFVEAKEAEAAKEAADADAILGVVTPEILRAAKKLKWVHIYSAGVERYRFPEFINSDIALTNGRIIQGPEIADHALALLLTLTRGTDKAVLNRAKQEWYKGEAKAIELRGKTAVVIGVGGIGTQIAERAHAFGMTVIGVDPRDVPFQGAISQVVRPDRIDTVLPKADVVFISAPHTPESEKMMGAKQFELMKRGAYFIAVSRGKLYDTNALVKALDSKRLSGAGLDVTDPEPLPKGHPLWNFDNVVITPHIATVSDQVGARYRELVLDNVARFANGEPLRNVVDKKKGY
jgi:phosphoglycerate dehydrogenase-like enzyme